jgi:hypothetical protein
MLSEQMDQNKGGGRGVYMNFTPSLAGRFCNIRPLSFTLMAPAHDQVRALLSLGAEHVGWRNVVGSEAMAVWSILLEVSKSLDRASSVYIVFQIQSQEERKGS